LIIDVLPALFCPIRTATFGKDISKFAIPLKPEIDETKIKIIIDILIVPVDESSKRINAFLDKWARVFGELVQKDIKDNDFVGIRTLCEKDSIKGGFKVTR
jgi:hypothetical protein